ncbi:MAG: hypothetical protein ACRDL7_00065 [Gaiellaceae bacterium]
MMYVGEDEHYYYFMHPEATNELGGLFDNIGNMFTRMVKFTPKSFTPGNIYKGLINTTLTTVTGGAYLALPSKLASQVRQVANVAVPVIAGGVLAATMGPSIMGMLTPKLTAAASLMNQSAGSDVIGAATGQGGKVLDAAGNIVTGTLNTAGRAVQIGGQLMTLLGKLPQNKQAEVVQQLTPEQIAYMERTGQIPPELKSFFDQVAQSAFNPPMQGVASPYTPYDPMGTAPKTAQAGFFGGMDLTTMLLFAVPAVFYLFTQRAHK